ncbi:hypothetical protein BpHYR1_051553 [Brachionus plicatilis]|uniref:Uncharacterized protein n=1 Tax=Brachionus plicatilis TaxID=10195 RepID=A0A3M7RM07_BRAPC|nr:hypothetical protein BpHYR1_051553 [Brachionus plicatilis]
MMMNRPVTGPPVPVVTTRRKPNAFEKSYKGLGLATFLAVLYLLLTLAFTAIEVARIFTGSLNRNRFFSYMLYPGNVYFPPNFQLDSGINIERQHHYLWPWSHPSLLITFPMLIATLFGFSAAKRATYSMIYLFFAISLFIFAVTPFLIGYYSSIINLHNNGITDFAFNTFASTDRALSIVMLILVLILFFVSLISFIYSAFIFACCRRKGGAYLNLPRRHPYVPLVTMNGAVASI